MWERRFPEPQFDGELKVIESRVLKDRHLKMTVRHPAGGAPIDAIAFNRPELPAGQTLRFVYRLDINRYRGLDQRLVNARERRILKKLLSRTAALPPPATKPSIAFW